MVLDAQRKYSFSREVTGNEFNPEYHIPRKSPQIKLSTATKKKPVNTQLRTTENKNFIDTTIYALKRRMFAPAWWIEGILLQLGTKEAWHNELITSKKSLLVATHDKVNSKNFIFILSLWNELISKSISNFETQTTTFKVEISKYLTGTQKQILSLSKEIEDIIAAPLKIFEVKTSKKTKMLALSKKGSMSFVRQTYVEHDVNGIWLTIHFSQPVSQMVFPEEFVNESNMASQNFITINPTIIQSMGSRASIKKVINYLFFEYSKQKEVADGFNTFGISSKCLSSFHKEILGSAQSLYDHGVLGWSNSAPAIKISDLKAKDNFKTTYFSWKLSDQVQDAKAFEQSVSKKFRNFDKNVLSMHKDKNYFSFQAPKEPDTLFPQVPIDELQQIRQKKRTLQKKEIKKAEFSFEKIVSSKKSNTLFQDVPLLIEEKKSDITPQETTQKQFNKLEENSSARPNQLLSKNITEKDFIILVSEFYESLRPTQKRTFEKERKNMSSSQFRAYMIPILQRRKNNSITLF